MMRDQPSTSKHVITIRSARGGYVTGINSDAIGWSCVALGGGRSKADSPIDHNAAIMLTAKVGDAVEEGGTLAVVYTDVDDHSGSSQHSQPATIIPKTLFVMRCTDAGPASRATSQGILGFFGSLGFLGFRV
jgi:thymidine phosphorylase